MQPAPLFSSASGASSSRALLKLIFGAHHTALADDVAVLLAGDFFRHLEDHLDQRVDRELLRAVEQDSALADVFDDAFVPGAGAVDAVAQRDVEFRRRARGTQVGRFSREWLRRTVVSGLVCSTRWVRRMVVQSYLYSAAQIRQT